MVAKKKKKSYEDSRNFFSNIIAYDSQERKIGFRFLKKKKKKKKRKKKSYEDSRNIFSNIIAYDS